LDLLLLSAAILALPVHALPVLLPVLVLPVLLLMLLSPPLVLSPEEFRDGDLRGDHRAGRRGARHPERQSAGDQDHGSTS
jgi:hypothetical protein